MYEGQNGRPSIGGAGSRMIAPPPGAPDAKNESDSHIRNALCYSEEISAQLHGEIATLEHRLDTGLTPMPPAPATNSTNTQEQTSRSHVLERMITLNQTLVAAIARLRDLRMRVEL